VKKFFGAFITVFKWLIIGVIFIEILCFLVISGSNYLIYGKVREGSRVRYDPYALFLNKGGVRPTAHNPPPPWKNPHLLIWMFGGSTMRGSTDHDDRTIPSYLAEMFNRREQPGQVTVVNYGENSFNSLLETKYLQKLLIEADRAPQVIIFYDGANDSSYFAQYRTPDGHHGYRRLRGLIESYHESFFGLLKPLNAAFYSSFTKEVYDKLRQTVVPLRTDSPELQQMVTLTVKRYDYVQKTAACYGARFLLFWQPIWWVESQEVAPAVQEQEKQYMLTGERFAPVRHNFAVIYLALAHALKEKPYFVDFQNVLCSRTAPVYQPDGVHLNDLGRRLVAQEMNRVLREKGVWEWF